MDLAGHHAGRQPDLALAAAWRRNRQRYHAQARAHGISLFAKHVAHDAKLSVLCKDAVGPCRRQSGVCSQRVCMAAT